MKFYNLYTEEGKGKKFAYAVGLTKHPVKYIDCPVCGRKWQKSILGDEAGDIHISLSNDNFPDFLGYDYRTFVSQKAREILENEDIKGFHLYETTVVSKNDLTDAQSKEIRHDLGSRDLQKIATNPPNYSRLIVDSKAKIDMEKSGVLITERCKSCGYKRKTTSSKIYVDLFYVIRDLWDGSDLFYVEDFETTLFCSERFLEVYKTNNLTGLRFVDVETI